MIIVDTALEKRERENNPIRVGVIGAGYMGRGLAIQIHSAFKSGMRLSALYNRTPEKAQQAFKQAGITSFSHADTTNDVEAAVAKNQAAICSDPLAICSADNIDVIVEATGEVEFGACVVLEAIKHGKHVILMNAELDAVCGPILKVYADKVQARRKDDYFICRRDQDFHGNGGHCECDWLWRGRQRYAWTQLRPRNRRFGTV